MWLVGLLVLIAAWEGAKAGFQQLRDDYRKAQQAPSRKAGKGKPSRARKALSSAHRDTGFAASEVLHGFPRFRHGFARGWHESRTAHDEAFRSRQSALADREETRRSVLRDVRAHQRRIAAARRDAEAEREQEVTWYDPARPRGRRRTEGQQEDRPLAPVVPIRSTPADPPARPSTDPPGCIVPTPGGAPGSHPDDQEPSRPEGNPVATAETTYGQQVAEAEQLISEADQEVARLRSSDFMDRVEKLSSADLDPGTLSRAAEIDDALKDQLKAAERVMESATAFRDGLQHDHGGLNEAHQSAPVEAADKTFYKG